MQGTGSFTITTFDTLLGYTTVILWWLFAIYAIYMCIATGWRQGVRFGILRLLSSRVMLPFLLILGISLLSAALVFVQPPYVAVVVSLVSPGGIRPQPLRAGLHWILPFLERDVSYPIYWQTYTMSGRPAEGAELGDDSIRARTSDGQEVRLDCSVIFRVDTEQAVSVHTDWQNRYIVDLVRPVTRGFVRTQVSQFTVREVNSSDLRDLETTLDRILRTEFANRGFILDQVLLRDVTFTAEYAESIERKQIALEGKEEALHKAQQMRNMAAGRKDAIKIEAEGQADALALIAKALEQNPNLLTYQYIEKLSPKLHAILVPSHTPLILPLPKLDEHDGRQRPLSMDASSPDLMTSRPPP